MSERFTPEQLEHAAHNLCAKTQNKDGWPIHAIAAWEHEQRRGDRLYQALCDMEAERDAAVRKAAADARTLAALREWLKAEVDDARQQLKMVTGFVAVDLHAELRSLNSVLAELDRLMARPDGAEEQV